MLTRLISALTCIALGGCFSSTVDALAGVQRTALTVSPAAPARIIWVLDNSGSMSSPADATNPACPVGCGAPSPCPADCETRKSQMVRWLGQQSFGLAQHASVIYPVGYMCGGPDTLSWFTSVQTLSDDWLTHEPAGGTPTGGALDFVATHATPADTTDTFVVLITDGVPNCNPENANNICTDPSKLSACQCTASSCLGSMCSLGCLDESGVAAASARVHAAFQRLLVVGLTHGDDVDSIRSAPQALSSMNIDLTPQCATDADCRVGTTCLTATHACSDGFFSVDVTQDLAPVTTRLSAAIAETRACLFTVGSGSLSDSTLQVRVGGALVPTSDLRLESTNRLRFVGHTCQRLSAGSLSVEASVLPSAVSL